MIERIRSFTRFSYDFVAGNDGWVAVAVVVTQALTYGLGRVGIPSWWVLPVTVVVVLPWSLWRARRKA